MSPATTDHADSIERISFPRLPLRHRAGRLVSAVCCAPVIAAVVLVASPASSGAYPTPNVTLQVHGVGGGAGMGQWGALGYALQGLSYSQILQHYYGTLAAGGSTSVNTSGSFNDSTPVSVALTENTNGGNLNIIVISSSGFTAGGVAVSGGHAALFELVGSTWMVEVSSGGCGGNWGTATPVSGGPVASPGSGELTLCYVGGNITVHGTIQGTVNSANQVRAINVVPLGDYVADVTPSESPASWGSLGAAGGQGEPQGFQELEAQAVAARSYVMARWGTGAYFGYADICDTTACQDYPGTANENLLTDMASSETAGQAVLLPSGSPALTQYSSSTGGYTAGGTFAAVPDDGDAVCVAGACNPYHAYTVNIPVSAVTARFPQIGSLISVQVIQRNGLGDVGGRVLQLALEGSSGTATMTGDTFAADFANFGMGGFALSNWFSVGGQPSGGIAGYWLVASDGGIFSFGSAGFSGSMGGRHLDAPMVGMARTTDHNGYWTVASDGGIFSFGDAGFQGSMGGRHLDAPMVGMAPTAAGGGYWTVASDGGIFSFGDAGFHGSMGAKHLDAPMVGMAPTSDGGGYWTVASDGGIFSFGDAAFHGSMGGQHLDQPIVGMAATPDDGGYWLVGADGGIFSFGDAPYLGSLPGIGLRSTAVAVLATATGQGYIVVTASGQAVGFGDAPQFGDVAVAVPGYGGHLVGGALAPQ
ncbi:MAG TPA: SpoIID/LytB domain-containing protein [Acidimicrobiales bacterium]|nr:SpoIID/LytB domain-containing protein [Acidimicrobiales bacterium]